MKTVRILVCLGALGGCASNREAELAMKDGKIALLEAMIEKQHDLIDKLSRKEQERTGAEDRLEKLQAQLDTLSAQGKNRSDLQALLYEEVVSRVNKLALSVAELEKKAAEKEKK